MPYATIQPPFTLNLREMPKKELQRYFQWFIGVIPHRVNELAEAVKQSPGFEAWQPDYTRGSLIMLGEWFAGQAETRRRTHEEVQTIQNRLVLPMDVPGEEITNRTFSLAMDIGMYLSQVFLKNYPFLNWELPLGNKRFVDYGQPSLTGFGPVALNPVRIAVTLAYAVTSKNKRHKRLLEVYDYWSQRVQSTS